MKKSISIILIITILLPFFSVNTFSEDNKWYFIVTAYYSPLPWQEVYLTWDFNSEKNLNWEWIRWASWKWVFSWMLAAPKNYEFGTKIYLEWLWIWEVSDRWWAIVNAWKRGYENDRIDVWMWYGDEWLRRSMYWGKRKVKWYITDSTLNITIDYNTIIAPVWATKWLKKISNIFEIWLWKGSDIWLVKKLQNLFLESWLYDWEIDWVYNNKIIDIVYDFQINNQIINWPNDYWAWYWWKNTRSLFLKWYLEWDFDKIDNVINKEKNQTWAVIMVQKDKSINTWEIVTNKYNIFDKAVSSKDEIVILQNILTELKLYKWELSGKYEDLVDTIYDYQISKWLITWINSIWAWNYWPMTRESLKTTYNDYLTNIEEEKINQAKIEADKRKEEQRKIELEQKYKQLEELSEKKADEKISNIGKPKFWEVSAWVRELQITLKELWFFDFKDTAIFWDKTKDSIFSFQVSNKLVSKKEDLWAWMLWPRTLEKMKDNLKNKYFKDLAKNSWINIEKIVSVIWYKI